MLDISEQAVRCAGRNVLLNHAEGVTVLRSDGFRSLQEAGFDLILCNPPYHTDFSVAKHFIEKGFNRLRIGGRMLMVVKREKWYRNKLNAVFGGCRELEKDGYFVLEAERRELCRHDLAARK